MVEINPRVISRKEASPIPQVQNLPEKQEFGPDVHRRGAQV
jgi:hypothetical protein